MARGQDLDAGQSFSPEDQAARAEIDRMYARLEEATHYEILGVSPNAEADAIQSAYLEQARQWHSDRFAGRTLGSAAPKLEAIFARISEAKEVLSDPEKRKEYDVYLDRKAKGLPTDVAAILKAEGLFEQASRLLRAGNAKKALPLLDQAIELNHAEPEFWVWRAYARFCTGAEQAEVARQEIQRALAERPRMAWGYYFLGRIALAAGETDEARRSFKKTLELDEKHPEATQQLRLLTRREEKEKKGGGLLGLLRRK